MTLMINLTMLFNNINIVKQFSPTVRVLYKQTDTITIDQFLALQAAKMKLDFVPFPDMQDERVSAGYLIGKLTEEASSTIIVTDSDILLNIGSMPAKNTALVYFVKDLKQAQKIEKNAATSGKRISVRKASTTKIKRQPVNEKHRDEADVVMSDFLNLPEKDADVHEKETTDKKVKDFLKSTIGIQLTNKYYDSIVNSVKGATDPIGWEIRLKVAVCDDSASRKIYDVLSPKFSELQALLS